VRPAAAPPPNRPEARAPACAGLDLVLAQRPDRPGDRAAAQPGPDRTPTEPPERRPRGDRSAAGPSDGYRPGGPSRRLARIGLVVAVAAALAGSVVVAVRTPPPVPAPARPAVAVPVFLDPVPPAPQPAAVATASTLDVPRLGISRSSLVGLGVDTAGELVPPASIATAGWFTGSAAPGQVGPTVIAGHVDSYAGPGIFFRLDTLRPGDLVAVGRSDGVTVRYRVTDVLTVPKDAFPTRAVYGPTPGPELRLITCGGDFDHSVRRYLSNVVVSAVYADAS
jgi:Sortase domain